jgi:hypothetical protein
MDHFMNYRFIPVIFLCLIFNTNVGLSQNYGIDAVLKTLPESSKKWLPWIMIGKDHLRCPYNAHASSYECAWFSRLFLNLNSSGGNFSFNADTFAETSLPLPGGVKHWPSNVMVNGTPVPITTKTGHPSLVLVPGIGQQVSGQFSWKALPDSIKIPQIIPLVRLTVNDIDVPNPKLGSDGELWLGQSSKEDVSDKDSASLSVYRLYEDSIPALLKTKLDLEVSGKTRELLIGPLLPAGFNVLSISSNLPVQWTPEGKIRVRTYAGKHSIEITGRTLQKSDHIEVPALSDPLWPKRELWAIQQDPDHRDLAIDLLSIDPTQTTFPEEWKKNAIYALEQGQKIPFNPKDPSQSASSSLDQLNIQRDIWLDSSGQGFSIRDVISGNLLHSWRIDVLDEYSLGKATINNENILVTQYNGKNGVEVRDTNLLLNTEGRINSNSREISPTGWQVDFDKVSINLNLPPGWKLITVTGADRISESWLKHWNLMNIFILCLITLGTAKILGIFPGIISFLTMLLLIPESNAPRWIWLVLISLVAFHRVFPTNGHWRRLLLGGEILAILAFFLMLVDFSIDHLRFGLHPILEKPTNAIGVSLQETVSMLQSPPLNSQETASVEAEELAEPAPAAMSPPPLESPTIAPAPPLIENRKSRKRVYKAASEYLTSSQQQNSSFEIYSAKSTIQTGFGIPDRTWHRIGLDWDGPVSPKHKIQLFMIPPLVHGILSFVRVFLMIFLGYVILYKGFLAPLDHLPKRAQHA